MISCILILYMALPRDFRLKAEVATVGEAPAACLFHSHGSPLSAAQSATAREDPDALYAHRDDIASARAAEKIWADRLARDQKDFGSAWKLARVRYWLGGHATEQDRKALYEAGIAA